MTKSDRKNQYFYGLGTIGRDMFYAFEANALLYFLSNVLSLSLSVFATMSIVLSILRIADAINDPITGLLIDNLNTKWGRFKPAILGGGLISVVFYLIMFANIGKGATFIIIFSIAYICWDISYGINDIAYWALMPTIAESQDLRDKFGSFARICASIGMYVIMVAWQPVTAAAGNTPQSWFMVAVAICVLYIGFLLFTIFGVKEKKTVYTEDNRTTFREMVKIIANNDQLVWLAISMALFMMAYCTTTGFAAYYMQYIFGDINYYPLMAFVCGLSQLAAIAIYPYASKLYSRKQLFRFAIILMFVGYLVFAHAEFSLVIVMASCVMVLGGQALVQVLMLVFLSDTIEYAEWKFGKRNESITLSLQPMINKIGGAVSTAFVSLTLILSGVKTEGSEIAAESIDTNGIIIMKIAMLVIPMILLAASYYIYKKKYMIDSKLYDRMVDDIKERNIKDLNIRDDIKESRKELKTMRNEIRDDILDDIVIQQGKIKEYNAELKDKLSK